MARIQTNVAALNAHRNLTATNMSLSKSIQKLSSGFRINKAADDAAGLAIANKLRSDARAMSQASRNATQAAALLQIEDGALNTISGILDRMKELASQAASDNVSSTQRTTLHSEFNDLRSEITRIVDTTNYQGTLLLDGNFGATINTGAGTLDAVATISNTAISGTPADTYNFQVLADGVLTVNNGTATGDVSTTVAVAASSTVTISQWGITFTTDSAFDNTTGGDLGTAKTLVVDAGTGGSFLVGASGKGSTAYDSDYVTTSNINMSVSTLGISTSDLQTSRTTAQTALANVDTAISAVATAIGSLGTAQNRMEFATQNILSMIENISAADSVIRDADLAYEMVGFTKNQILQQAGTAMLAQANAAPQGILALLAG